MRGELGHLPETIQPERGRAVATVKVRTKNEPGKVIEVESTELTDLERLGLIHSRELAEGETTRKGEKTWRPEPTAEPATAPAETEKGGK